MRVGIEQGAERFQLGLDVWGSTREKTHRSGERSGSHSHRAYGYAALRLPADLQVGIATVSSGWRSGGLLRESKRDTYPAIYLGWSSDSYRLRLLAGELEQYAAERDEPFTVNAALLIAETRLTPRQWIAALVSGSSEAVGSVWVAWTWRTGR